MDLLTESEFSRPSCKAVWTEPAPGEKDAPPQRIIHIRGASFASPARLQRFGLRLGRGYFKCGSHREEDWVVDCRLLVWERGDWREALVLTGQQQPKHRNIGKNEVDEADVTWFDLHTKNIVTTAVRIEIRRCAIDRWWTPWNLAMTGLVLQGDPLGAAEPAGKTAGLALGECEIGTLPQGVEASVSGTEVRFSTRCLQVGFRLDRPEMTRLSIDEDGTGNTGDNLLQESEAAGEYTKQGFQLQLCGDRYPADRLYGLEGTTTVNGNVITYAYAIEPIGQKIRIQWEILEDQLLLTVEREGEQPLRAWQSSIMRLAFNCKVTPTGVIGSITRKGETGLVGLPALLHAPKAGTLEIRQLGGGSLIRADSIRPISTTAMDIKVGELPQPEGDYALPAGKHSATLQFRIGAPMSALDPSTLDLMPPLMRSTLEKCVLTALPYRPDSNTYSNNFNSIHAPLCMDNWSALSVRFGRLLPGLQASDLLRETLERWLDGGPGYACGASSKDDHAFEDEYIMTGTASLLGLAEYMQFTRDPAWFRKYKSPIVKQIENMRARDLDDDGIVESEHRLGISGQGQWSTNWYDVISFGWKDAFANALLYPALRLFADAFRSFGESGLADEMGEWADRLYTHYVPAFYNPQTGWIAGWRCKEDRLHDYAFLYVNGSAITAGLLPEPMAREVMERLWDELARSGLADYRMGLPGNLRSIANEDLATGFQDKGFGHYQNGGLTHSQARHFVNALYKVGMIEEGDRALEQLISGLSEGIAYSGVGTGVDWRRWDGTPTGYEGLLCDQFGILSTLIDRYTVYRHAFRSSAPS